MQTAVRPQQKTDTISSTQSIVLMKKMVLASVSEICYLRSLFPDDSFDEVNLGDNRVHMLRAPEDPASGIGVLRKSLESAFEALELRYLRSMSLAIFSGPEGDPNRKLFEAFNFIFKYPDDQTVQATLVQEARDCTPAKIRMQGNNLLKLLFAICSNMSPLPPSPVLEIKLFYREEVTPADYNPPHYTDATHDQHIFFEDQPAKVQLGRLVTPHHTMSLLAAFVPPSQEVEETDFVGAADLAVQVAAPSEEPTGEEEGAVATPPATSSQPSPLARFLTLPAEFPAKGVDPLVYLISRAALATALTTAPSSSSPLTVTALRAVIEGYAGPLPLACLDANAGSAVDDATLWRTHISSVANTAGITTGAGVTIEQVKRLAAVLEGEGLLAPAGSAAGTTRGRGGASGGRAATSWTLTSSLAAFSPAVWSANAPQTGVKRSHQADEVQTPEVAGGEEVEEEVVAPPPTKRARVSTSSSAAATTTSHPRPTELPPTATSTRSKSMPKQQVVPTPVPVPRPTTKARAGTSAPSHPAASIAPIGGSGSTALPASSKLQGLSSVACLPGFGAATTTTTTGWATTAGRSVWGQHSLPVVTHAAIAGGSAATWGGGEGEVTTFGRGSSSPSSSNSFAFGDASVPASCLQPTPAKGGMFGNLSSLAALTAPVPRRSMTAPAAIQAVAPAPAPTAPAKGAAARRPSTSRPAAGEESLPQPPRKQQQSSAVPRRPSTASAAAPAAASKARGRPLEGMAATSARLFDF